MSTVHTVGAAGRHPNGETGAAGRWGSRLRSLTFEHWLWVSLTLVALGMRLVGLGDRALSHDESLHALYSWYITDAFRYSHDPMMHGPFLFHVNALLYLLFGASDFTARLFPALVGTATVAVLWWFRGILGRRGALLAAVLLTISPSLLFHSRYIRNDIYVALCSLLWALGLIRYVQTGFQRWLYLLASSMLVALVSKENAFITGAIFGLFSLCGAGWGIWRTRGAPRLAACRLADTAIVMGVLVAPFLVPFALILVGREPMPVDYGSQSTALVVAGLLGGIGLVGATGFLRFLRPAWWGTPVTHRNLPILFAGFWFVALAFYTNLFSAVSGIQSGVVGSLGYWLEQQGVMRGGQPWFYYPYLALLYEFLPLALLAASVPLLVSYSLAKSSPGRQSNQSDNEVPWLVPGFLLIWTIGSYAGYTVAGEKMPWLMVHLVLPTVLLGSWAISKWLSTLALDSKQAIVACVLGGAGFACWMFAAGRTPLSDSDREAIRETMQWLSLVVGGCGLLAPLAVGLVQGRSGHGRLLGVSAGLALGILTLHVAWNLAYVRYDSAREYLVYAHGTPDVKQVLADIKAVRSALPEGYGSTVLYDHEVSWPMAWYFRDDEAVQLYDGRSPTADLQEAPVILAGAAIAPNIRPLVRRDYVTRRFRLIWWPEESYKEFNAASLQGVFHRDRRRQWLDRFLWREHSGLTEEAWPHVSYFDMHVKRDLAPVIWPSTKFPTIYEMTPDPMLNSELDLQLDLARVVDASWAQVELARPLGVSVGPEGRRVVTDGDRDIVSVFGRNGELLWEVGGHCDIASPETCDDLDGDGPFRLGDGQFNEPWGAAMDANGRLFVADTWNHRVQRFSPDGRFELAWGAALDKELPNRNPIGLYGPRGITVEAHGSIVVADTGHHRLLRFSPDGVLLAEIGSSGTGPAQFQEPVAVLPGANGDLWVTDTWNGRIQRISGTNVPLGEISVPLSMWSTRYPDDKPFVGAVPGGLVVTDPLNSRLVFFGLDGELLGHQDLTAFQEAGQVPPMPVGIAVDGLTETIVVADAANSRLLELRLPSLPSASQ
ncbi:MAG: TIGR03663 family protein [Caldilineaceae bacterium SB0662_bin_9]|uniref:TIGR03663 family protein n=1 Tax=Caldilineaceae bacterium SB0662_bin_9 TaxID=2605258 RepID=A0A6B1DMY4_9CHLR|nr:TIGR03663 family protein [Caldilineaceae bacterium SB0662_bin_9]